MYRFAPRLIQLLLALACAAGFAPAWAQADVCPPGASPDEAVKSALEKSREQIRKFRDAGGKPEAADHPAVAWSAALWRCREAYPQTPAAAEATAEAIHILIHAARAERALQLADSLPPADGAWERLPSFLLEAADELEDFRGCVRRLERALPHLTKPQARAAAQMALAGAHRRLDQTGQAAALYEAVQREAAGTPQAVRAAAALRRLRGLNPGQPAPRFEARARDGKPVSLAGFRGRTVVLIFWSTT